MESPPAKRLKLDPPSESPNPPETIETDELEDTDGENCSICLQPYADRTVIATCSHEFCFECLLIWTEQSRRCPLCSQDIGKYLMHHIRSKYDYQKHYLAPLRSADEPQAVAAARQHARQRAVRRREVEWGRRRQRELEELDELERAIEKRRWVYRHEFYAMHVASNPYTRYRPFPTPAQFSASQDYISRATIFIRRELRVWTGLDVEFLTTFTVSLMKSLDIRSEPAVRLLSEFLDMDADRGHEHDNAEHFAHELYCYLRSPYRDLAAYDRNVQYDVPAGVPPPDVLNHNRRWQSRSRSRSRSEPRTRLRSQSRPSSASPSGLRSPRPVSRPRLDREDHATASTHHSSRRHRDGDAGTAPRSPRPSRSGRPDTEQLPNPSEGRQSRSNHRSPSDGVPTPRSGLPQAPRDSHLNRNRYDGKGKGKERAVDSADESDGWSRADSPREEDMTSRGNVNAGILGNAKNRTPSRANGGSEMTPSALSTPPRSADLSAAIIQNVRPSPVVSRVAPPISSADKTKHTDHVRLSGGDDNAQASTLQKPSMEGKQPVRVRRNPWQTVQEYLSGGASGPHPSKHGDKASNAGLASEARSQARQSAVSNPRGGALRPEDPSSSGEGMPSLLLRLSDPTPPSAAAVQHVAYAVPDAARGHLPVHEGGKGISAPEIMARTRARLAKTDEHSAVPSPSVPPSVQHPGTGSQPSTANNAKQGSDVGAVEHMSSEDAAQPRGAAGPALAASADPRTLLLQKLAAEKRDAADIPTAEKAPVSAARRPSVPMALGGADRTRAAEGAPPKAAPDVVPAERIAERKEAELRSQAQLRARLAAARRAALAQPQRSTVGSGDASGTSTGTVDGDLAVQESALRSRLKGRQAET